MIVVPYVPGMLRAATREALPWDAVRPVDVSADRHAYWRLLRDLWASGSDVTIIEQDIVPHKGAIDDLDECGWGWCAFPYDDDGMLLTAFGMVRWRGWFTAKHPDVVEQIPEQHRDWVGLDGVVIGELHRRGEKEHIHGPEVRHLHHKPPPQRRTVLTATRLRYVGDGQHYFNGIPKADFETSDEAIVAQCLESKLYVIDSAPEPRTATKLTARDISDRNANTIEPVAEGEDPAPSAYDNPPTDVGGYQPPKDAKA